MKVNPYNWMQPQGVPGARNIVLPANYAFELTMDTWWSAVQRARLFSDFTGLDALYSYVMKSSTLVRAAIDKRLRPLQAREFGICVNGKEDESLTTRFNSSALVRELVYQRGLANFTYARVIGVTKDFETYVYPLRNLDVVNKAVKRETYDTIGQWVVKSHANLFWLQTSYHSEDTLGLLEPICRDYINACNAQNNWQTASQFNAYQQMMMYFENGDESMREAADQAAAQVGLGQVIVAGKTTNEDNGEVIKDISLENVFGNASADTFRIFKENIDTLYEHITLVILGSSLLLSSAKNTNSERLVRAHLKGFYDICEADAVSVQDWMNVTENKIKLAYIIGMPELATATVKVKPSSYVDIGDIDTFTNMFEKMSLWPTDAFISKVGLDKDDVVGYEDSKTVAKRNKELVKVRGQNDADGSSKSVVASIAKRLFVRKRPGDGEDVG